MKTLTTEAPIKVRGNNKLMSDRRCPHCGGAIVKDEVDYCLICGRLIRDDGRLWISERRRRNAMRNNELVIKRGEPVDTSIINVIP